VVGLSLPVIQTRMVEPGEYVGYARGFQAQTAMHVATVAAGYADGLLRSLSNRGSLWHGEVPCAILGRVSMDLITVDISHLPDVPQALDILSVYQTVDELAAQAGTIGYEVLTSLGPRYQRRYLGGGGR